MKKKYYYMDVLRLLSMLAIVFYHMMITLYLDGARQLESVHIFYENANAHIATIGVGIFFMLSGAGLMLSSEKKEFHATDFYKRRLVKILIPFYVVNILYLAYTFIYQKIQGGSIRALLPQRFTILRVICALFGLDTYLLTFLGGDTYTRYFGDTALMTGIGEWFLGCLVLMYVLFPLLRAALKKNKWLTIAIATVYYILILVFYDKIPIFSGLANAGYLNFFVKIYDFILGMFLSMVIEETPRWTLWPSLAVVLLYLFCPIKLPVEMNISIVVLNLAIYLVFLQAEPLFAKAEKLMRGISFLCKHSYVYFLLHHVVILQVTINWIIRGNTRGVPLRNIDIPFLFLEEMLLTAIFTAIVAFILALPDMLKKKTAAAQKEEKSN